jgi:outer membrane receptor protein involved in Fe transport
MKLLSSSLILTVALAITPLVAQQLDPVIVSVSREGLPTDEVALVVDSFGAIDLQQTPALALDDKLKASAAFQLFRRTGSLSANPTAQGVSLRNIGPNGAGRTLVLVDGIPLNDPFGGWVTWSKTSQLNIAAVEIVHGGGSGSWGSAALGGTIQALSPPAEIERRSALQLEVGDFGTVAAEIATQLYAGANTLSVSARGLHSDGFRRKAPGSAGPIDRSTGLEQGYLELDWTRRTAGGTTGSITLRGFSEDRGNGTPLQANRTRELMLASRAEGTRDLFGDEARWSAQAYLQTQEYRSLFTAVDDARETEQPVLDQYAVPADAAGAAAQASWAGPDSQTTLGADARWVQGETRENYFRSGDVFLRNRIAGGTQASAGVFANYHRSLTPEWHLDFGGRLDVWELSDGSRVETNRTDGSIVRNDRYADRSGTEFNPRLGLVWQATENWAWQAAAYEAYRLPTLNEFYRPFRVGSVITEANPNLETEHSRGFELGTTWRSGRASFRVTGFVTEVEDAVANVTLGFGPGFVPGAGFVPAGGVGRQRRNLDQITIEGFELGGEWQASDALRWRVDYLYSDARDDATDRVLPQASKHTLVAGFTWQPANAWTIAVSSRYVSDAFEDDANLLTLDEALTFDLYAGYAVSEDAEVFLSVENLTDEDVISGRTTNGLIDLGTPRFARVGMRWYW